MHNSNAIILLRRTPKGFALLVTLLMMVLLTILALGLLTLSSVTLRAGDAVKAQATARANARLALAMAVGQLQTELGPDRRISAPAAILDPGPTGGGMANSHFTGVWNSRREFDGTGNLVIPPDIDKDTSFRNWLVTATTALRKDDAKTANYSTSGIRLLGTGTSTSQADWVYAPKMASPGGSLAWWTSDDGVKQRVNAGHQAAETRPSNLLAQAGSMGGGTDGQHLFDKTLPSTEADWGKSITRSSVGLAPTGSAQPRDGRFHDISTTGSSLLVDVCNGGMRKCMNLAMESATSPVEYTLEKDIPWDFLRHYCRLYRLTDGTNPILTMSNGRPKVKAGSNLLPVQPDANPSADEKHLRLNPVVVKFMVMVSFATQKFAGATAATDKYGLHFYFYPILVLWNPYNVDLDIDQFSVVNEKLPLQFDIQINDASVYKFDWRSKSATAAISTAKQGLTGQENLGNYATVPAGETMVLYYNRAVCASNTGEHYVGYFARKNFDFPTVPGMAYKNIRANANSLYQGGSVANEVAGLASDRVKVVVNADVTDQTTGSYKAQNAWDFSGVSNNMTMPTWGGPDAGGFKNKQSSSFLMQSGSPNISFITAADAPGYTMSALENNPTPFMLLEYEQKAGDEDLFPQKHWVQSLPAHPYTSVTRTDWGADPQTPWYALPVALKVHSISSVTEAFTKLNISPESQNLAYIGPSYEATDGQLHVTSQGIPVAPLHSLGQLQHLPTYDTSTYLQRPLQFGQNNAIGNSFASPGIAPAAVTQQGWDHWWNDMGLGAGYALLKAPHVRHDYSYTGNANLYDTWFFSSIAHQDSALNTSDGTTRSMKQVATDFFVNGKGLPNGNYAPAPGSGTATVASLFDSSQPKSDAYRKLAANIVVEGGFNVNSTSVEAWKLLLSGLNSRKVVTTGAGTGALTVKGGTADRFDVSRYPLANAGAFDGKANVAEAWGGYRELTEDEISSLAGMIVQQVKRYGPFRSLSEFVNRRLVASSDDRSLMGPLARALESSSINTKLQAWGSITAAKIQPTQYPFKEAALGPLLQGAPGYVTQADLLQSLAPVINVRSDCFTVRAYGDALDSTGRILARAWCEATIQRRADFVDPVDPAWTAMADLHSPTNVTFGRRFEITGFRWLSPADI